jgi:hypothetical protein
VIGPCRGEGIGGGPTRESKAGEVDILSGEVRGLDDLGVWGLLLLGCGGCGGCGDKCSCASLSFGRKLGEGHVIALSHQRGRRVYLHIRR